MIILNLKIFSAKINIIQYETNQGLAIAYSKVSI